MQKNYRRLVGGILSAQRMAEAEGLSAAAEELSGTETFVLSVGSGRRRRKAVIPNNIGAHCSGANGAHILSR